MNLYENFRLALRGLAANKLRAILTMLGIIIGVAAVITLVSVGEGVQSFITGQFEGIGNNLLFVVPGQIQPGEGPPRRGGAGLTNKDVEAIADPLNVPDVISVVPEYGRSAVVAYGSNEARPEVTGTTPDYQALRNFYPAVGNFFDEQDLSSIARVAVLGQTVYDKLFPDGEPPIGEIIKINNVNFRVIGLMESKGGSGFNDQDNIIFVPITTAQRRLFPARRSDGQYRVNSIYAQMIDPSRQDAAISQIEFTLRQTHGIGLADEDDFTVFSQEEVIGAFAEITSMLTVFLGGIAGISLVVGGIGIMNIMLVSVTERTKEIGLRKALGAKQQDILWQFLVEALVIALFGGLIGLTIGIIGAQLISRLSADLQPTVAWNSVALAIGISSFIGLFFGIYPARRAARLNPIDALRYE